MEWPPLDDDEVVLSLVAGEEAEVIWNIAQEEEEQREKDLVEDEIPTETAVALIGDEPASPYEPKVASSCSLQYYLVSLLYNGVNKS